MCIAWCAALPDTLCVGRWPWLMTFGGQLKLHGSTFDLRLVLLYRNVVSSVLSKAADGSHATHARGASLQSRIVESNLVAINASTWWLPDWMVLRLRCGWVWVGGCAQVRTIVHI